jgi:DNA invertase Pin-like site-specific DNA recombinase
MQLGYARVSKGDDQTNVAQAKALKAAGCDRIFEEIASGGRWERPELHRLLDHLRPGDTIVVWKLDRLSRSLKDVLHIMERIGKVGAGFKSLTEAIDTTTAAGRMMMQMIGAFAEFERAMIRERTRAGLASARSEGRVGGRPRKLKSQQAAAAIDDVLSGKRTIADSARLFGVSAATVSRLVAEARRDQTDLTAETQRQAGAQADGRTRIKAIPPHGRITNDPRHDDGRDDAPRKRQPRKSLAKT